MPARDHTLAALLGLLAVAAVLLAVYLSSAPPPMMPGMQHGDTMQGMEMPAHAP